MRIGVLWVPVAGLNYRAVYPVRAMAGRGHEIVPPRNDDGEGDLDRLASCDVVHVYRRCDSPARRLVRELDQRGIPITYDNDDDFMTLPESSPTYAELGGALGRQAFANTVEVARAARVFTTTNAQIADTYRRVGVERVEVIGNYLAPGVRRRYRHEEIIIGWIAAAEHQTEATAIGIADALQRVLARHENAHVECIGVDLALPERYRHDPNVPFDDLPERMGRFDIGIAPLVDIPWNRARSDIKVKEYAASGVAWLASPVGPYLGLGEEQGGRLVPDDGWFDALDRLVTDVEERERLAGNAASWAATQTIEAVADTWEQVFAEAAGTSVVPA